MSQTVTNPYQDLKPHLARVWSLGFAHGYSGQQSGTFLDDPKPEQRRAYSEGLTAGEQHRKTPPQFGLKEILAMDETKDLGRALTSLGMSMYARRYIRLTLIEQGTDPALAKRYSKVIAWTAYLVAANASIGWRIGKHAAKEWSGDA